jgi:photosystem II stability/assembly factor-like uncharacterized protein
MFRKLFLALFFLTSANFLLGQNLAALADSVKSGFRGLSVVNEKVIWMSGRKGLVGNSYNAGKKWKWNRVKGFENSDFRSIYAFDKKNAVIANAGFPATILFTTNAGKTWTTCYSTKDSAMFFDGIDFWDNKHGMIFGDPINGKMYLSETFDGGKTWKEIPFEDRPQLQNGEASFAASGTTIRTLSNGQIFIATGGTVSRLWHSRDYGHHWEVFNTPILQGKSSQGIFSIAFYDTLHGVIVGGDYLCDTCREKNCFITSDGGKTWIAPKSSPGGYRSCVSFGTNSKLFATGPSGTDISYDGGKIWENAYKTQTPGYNVVYLKNSLRTIEIYLVGGKARKIETGKIYMENAIFD